VLSKYAGREGKEAPALQRNAGPVGYKKLSEIEFQGELDLSRIASGSQAGDGSLPASPTALEGIGLTKVDIIREVEKLRPELQIAGFRPQGEILLD